MFASAEGLRDDDALAGEAGEGLLLTCGSTDGLRDWFSDSVEDVGDGRW